MKALAFLALLSVLALFVATVSSPLVAAAHAVMAGLPH